MSTSRVSWACFKRRAKLARLQPDTRSAWFQTLNLIQSNRTAVAENKTQNLGGIDPEKLYRVTLTRFLHCEELSPICSYEFAYI